MWKDAKDLFIHGVRTGFFYLFIFIHSNGRWLKDLRTSHSNFPGQKIAA